MLSSLGDKYGPRVALAGCLLGSALSMVSIDHFLLLFLLFFTSLVQPKEIYIKLHLSYSKLLIISAELIQGFCRRAC